MTDLHSLEEHSLRFLEMAFRTDRQGEIKAPDGYGKSTRVCGDTIEIFLSVRENRIKELSYCLKGCFNTNACANTLIYMVQSKTIEEAWQITPKHIADDLQTLSKDHFHSAELVIAAFHAALMNFREFQQKSWKRPYGAETRK